MWWNATHSITKIKPILRNCMPMDAHIHEWYCISSVSRFKKKKDWPTDPPNFQAKRANKPFIFLGLFLSMSKKFCSQFIKICHIQMWVIRFSNNIFLIIGWLQRYYNTQTKVSNSQIRQCCNNTTVHWHAIICVILVSSLSLPEQGMTNSKIAK